MIWFILSIKISDLNSGYVHKVLGKNCCKTLETNSNIAVESVKIIQKIWFGVKGYKNGRNYKRNYGLKKH